MNELTTMNNAPQLAQIQTDVIEQVIGQGDVSRLTPGQRTEYILAICKSLHLNPLTQPIRIMNLSGRTALYATKDCSDQLRMNNGVSLRVVSREKVDDLLVVTVQATMPDGRVDEATGAISVGSLKGEALANAMMKAETKAKRRVTLSICGLGLIDETEVESVQHVEARPTPGMAAAQIESTLKKGKAALAQFEDMKARIGAERYYQILSSEGFDEAKDIPNRGAAELVWGLMEMAAANVTDAEVVSE
jgi:hypothetical protein